jgi:hypothetical protein
MRYRKPWSSSAHFLKDSRASSGEIENGRARRLKRLFFLLFRDEKYLKPVNPSSSAVCCILLVPRPSRTELILAFVVVVVESDLGRIRSNLCLEMVAITSAVVVRGGEDTGGNNVTLVVPKHRRINIVVVIVAFVDVEAIVVVVLCK